MTDDSSFIKPHTRVWVTFKETTVILSCVKDPSIYLPFSRPSRDHYGRHRWVIFILFSLCNEIHHIDKENIINKNLYTL